MIWWCDVFPSGKATGQLVQACSATTHTPRGQHILVSGTGQDTERHKPWDAQAAAHLPSPVGQCEKLRGSGIKQHLSRKTQQHGNRMMDTQDKPRQAITVSDNREHWETVREFQGSARPCEKLGINGLGSCKNHGMVVFRSGEKYAKKKKILLINL